MYWRSCSGVMPVPVSVTDSLRTRPAEASNRSQSMSQTTRPPATGSLGVDRVKPVDGQLAQALKVGALGAEALEQERGVRDGSSCQSSTRRVAVGCVVALRKLAGHLVW